MHKYMYLLLFFMTQIIEVQSINTHGRLQEKPEEPGHPPPPPTCYKFKIPESYNF